MPKAKLPAAQAEAQRLLDERQGLVDAIAALTHVINTGRQANFTLHPALETLVAHKLRVDEAFKEPE